MQKVNSTQYVENCFEGCLGEGTCVKYGVGVDKLTLSIQNIGN